MPGDMNVALALAQQICWDEGYGYNYGGHAASYADGADCGGLVFHCLHQAGYNVADTSPGTSYMPAILRGIGFTEIPYSIAYIPKHGDIVVMNHYETGHNHGHTCFIAENINAYTHGYLGWRYCNGTVDICPLAKIEASSTRGHTSQGDHDNGLGAYTEVWCHTFSNLFTPYDPLDPDTGYYANEVSIFRDPNFTPDDGGGVAGAVMLLFKMVGG